MGRLRQPLVPDGPIRLYYERLHALHVAAGELSTRELQRRTRSDRRPAGINPTTIHDVFAKPRLSRWEVVREIVTQLGGNVEEFAELWHRARNAEILGISPPPVRTVPPGGSAVSLPRTVPAEVQGFVGRDEHLKRLDELVNADAGGIQIAVLTGMGGIGKTALAVHWAHRVADRFPDGQLFVNLRGFDPAGQAVPPATALRGLLAALDVPADRIPNELDALTASFRSLVAGRRILLVLDNARNAEQVRPLLPGSGPAVVVVTSRDQLTPLVAVEEAQPLQIDPLSTSEAWRLLARRLGAQRIEAEPDTANAIIAACAGLPLALAVVTARAQQSRFATLAEITAEVLDSTQRLDALDAGDPASQVRAVFSWSYAALPDPAAQLFRLLGLHPGPGISMTAAASLAGIPVAEARQALTELTQANLLTEYAVRRYSTHDLLRAYASELISSSDGSANSECARAAHDRLIDHYVHVAHAANRLIHPLRDPNHLPLSAPAPGVAVERFPDVDAAIAWLDSEYPVLIAILNQPEAAGSDRRTWQLAWALETYLGRRGYWHDLGSAWEAGIQAGRRLGDTLAEAHAMRGVATAQIRLTRYADAEQYLQRALDLYAQTRDQVGQAFTYRAIQSLQTQRGDRRAGVAAIEKALALFQAAGHQRGQAGSLNNLGVSLLALDETDRAIECCDQALTLFEQLGDREGQAHTWDTLGLARHRLGHHADAAQCYERALDLYRNLGDRYEEAGTLSRLGDTHHATGRTDVARAAWQQAAEILSDLHHPDADRVLAKLRPVHARQSNPSDAGQQKRSLGPAQ